MSRMNNLILKHVHKKIDIKRIHYAILKRSDDKIIQKWDLNSYKVKTIILTAKSTLVLYDLINLLKNISQKTKCLFLSALSPVCFCCCCCWKQTVFVALMKTRLWPSRAKQVKPSGISICPYNTFPFPIILFVLRILSG